MIVTRNCYSGRNRPGHDYPRMRVAALDLGTNTFRILIAEVADGSVQILAKDQIITRLGGGYDEKAGRLSDEGMERSLAALRKFAKEIARHKPEKVRAAATEIVRRAHNGGDFCKRVKRETRIEIEVIEAKEEAALAFSGISAYLPSSIESPFVTLDVGGGSTEWAGGEAGGRMIGWISLPLGVVELSEKTLMGDPPTAGSLECAERQVWEAIEEVPRNIGIEQPVEVVVGAGGTATSLAVLDMGLTEYDVDRVQNHRIPVKRIEALERRLGEMTFNERAGLFPLTGGREDVIIPGAIITRVSLKRFGAKELLVSDAGLLEGLLMAAAH